MRHTAGNVETQITSFYVDNRSAVPEFLQDKVSRPLGYNTAFILKYLCRFLEKLAASIFRVFAD
jgi:hypothetical protein